MKLFDTILFSLAILFMLIGLHQAMMVGFGPSYWLFMLSIGCLLLYQMRKKKQQQEAAESKTADKSAKKRRYKM
jgi:4-hydroxybenzoate polyprenyltransferase